MKKILISVMMFAVLASCSKNENSADINSSVPEIKLSGKALSVETKGAFTETTPSAETPLKSFVIGSKVDGDYTTANRHVSGVMNFTDKAVNFSSVVGDPLTKRYDGENPVHLIGFHPSTNWADAGDGTASIVINGTQDVMFTKQITTTAADVAAGGTPKSFKFSHKLTMLEVKVVVDGDQDISDAWGVLKELSLPGKFNSKATVTMGTGATSTIVFSEEVTNWSFYTLADATFAGQAIGFPRTDKAAGAADTDAAALIAKSKVVGYTMFAPVTVAAGDKAFELAVTTGLKADGTNDVLTTVPVILKSDATGTTDYAGSTEGYKFSILLVFKAKTIHATATVEAWKLGGTTILPIE